MSESFIGQVMMFGGNFAPENWAFCNGQLLPISQYDALYSLIGTTYGGDGNTTFAVPDLRARIPVHRGPSHNLGQAGGAESVMLTAANVPPHIHPLQATTAPASSTVPATNAMLATTATSLVWSNSSATPDVGLSPASVSFSQTGGAPVPTEMPYLVINYIICLNGIYPSRS